MTITQYDFYWWRGTHLALTLAGTSASGLTNIWYVYDSKVVTALGTVKWFSRWRKYAFCPRPNTLFEETCFREIAEFCEQRTKEHREQRRKVAT